jgi:hypothetical protein
MTDKTGNSKIRPPKLAITREMIEAGKAKLDELTAMSMRDDIANDCADEVTDDLLVAEVFLAVWQVYWSQVMGEQRKKENKGNVIMLPQKRRVILPGEMGP